MGVGFGLRRPGPTTGSFGIFDALVRGLPPRLDVRRAASALVDLPCFLFAIPHQRGIGVARKRALIVFSEAVP
jgi:hypothetical protein